MGLFTGPREKKYAVVVLFWGDWGVCKLTFVRLRSAGIADRKVSWLPCAGSILLRRARGESRGGRRRDVGTAFWCVFDVLAQPRGRRPPSWAGLQSCAMWELSLGVVLGACSAGGVFLVGGAFIRKAPGVLRVRTRANSSCEIHVHFSVFYISLFFKKNLFFSMIFNHLPRYKICFLQSK